MIGSVARDLLDEEDLQDTVQRAVHLAVEHLEPVDWASICLVRGRRRIETPASTHPVAERADQLQYELDDGPCLDAICHQQTFSIEDYARDEAYPRWTRRVTAETPIRSSVSFQLFTAHNTVGALNLYAGRAGAFGDQDLAEGSVFAAHAAIALRSAQTDEQLRLALDSRTVIGQAQGILIERFRLDPVRAFELLSRVSQDTNTKLVDVAQRLVETGETPGR